MTTSKTYAMTLTEEQLGTILNALDAEIEHAHDAARDGDDDPGMRVLEARYEMVRHYLLREMYPMPR